MARYSPAPPHFSIGKTVNMRDQVIPKTGGILQAKRLLLVAVLFQEWTGTGATMSRAGASRQSFTLLINAAASKPSTMR